MKKFGCYLLLALLCLDLNAEYRSFTNLDGVSIMAKLVSLKDRNVTIMHENGKSYTFPLAKLCEEDRQYVIEALKEPEPETPIEKPKLDRARAEVHAKYPENENMSKTEAEEAMKQAYNNLDAKEFERAIALYASIPRKNDHYADARRRAGYNVLGRELGRWKEATVFLLDAYEVDPKNEKILEDIGRAYLRLDDYDEAEYFLKEAGTRTAKKALKELEAKKRM